ncbi:hypothetical protein EZV62_003717 [Acer yangbiense]|uniref:Uncharacterized protein n=1 Tax=Acer yangbiense TaxID=1000413 RepID=A0A5C7IJE8_9ROSI|nr:hypothetical protein EZV62_003717 [Acer yangbiense]
MKLQILGLCRYYTSSRLTEKSDVYSFGIILPEPITGQHAVIKGRENTHIVQWVCPFLERGDIRRLIDSRLGVNFDTNSTWKAIETTMSLIPAPPSSHVLHAQIFLLWLASDVTSDVDQKLANLSTASTPAGPYGIGKF